MRGQPGPLQIHHIMREDGCLSLAAQAEVLLVPLACTAEWSLPGLAQ